MVTKYYVGQISSNTFEYFKDSENRIFEFDTEEEARAELQEQKKRNLKGLPCWKKEEIEE